MPGFKPLLTLLKCWSYKEGGVDAAASLPPQDLSGRNEDSPVDIFCCHAPLTEVPADRSAPPVLANPEGVAAVAIRTSVPALSPVQLLH